MQPARGKGPGECSLSNMQNLTQWHVRKSSVHKARQCSCYHHCLFCSLDVQNHPADYMSFMCA